MPDVANVEHYARIVKEKSTLRRLIQAGQQIVREGLSQEKTPRQLLGDATGEIFDIAEDSIRGGFMPIGQVVKHNLEVIEDARNRQGMLSGLPTGFTELDRMTSGLQATDLIIAGGPALGRKDLLRPQHRAARGVSRGPLRRVLLARDVEGAARVPRSLLGGRRGCEEGPRRLCLEGGDGAPGARRRPRSRARTSSWTTARRLSVPEMRAKGQRLKREKGLDLIVVDYLQLMMGHGRFDNRTQEVSQISRGLKLLAKELQVPIIALSQLSRQPE